MKKESTMADQGRFLKVMFALMGSMTLGALLLLGLEGKPIKPMAFSLSSTAQLAPVQTAMGTESGIARTQWRQIEIEYANTGNKGEVSLQNGPSGRLAMEYHFIIGNGTHGDDGEIFATHCWTKQRQCVNTNGQNGGAIRICLMDEGRQHRSTPRQARQLESLVQSLVRNCDRNLEIHWVNRG